MEFEPNLLAVFVAALVNMAVGFAWYSPYLFLKRWVAESGVNMEAGKTNMLQSLSISFVSSLVLAYVLAVVLGTFRANDLQNVLLVAGCMWLGFVATLMTSLVAWEMKSWTLYAIHTGYWLVSFILMASAIHFLS